MRKEIPTVRTQLKLWVRAALVAHGGVIYGNQMGQTDDSDAATALGGGSIVVHKE
ncbi:MAG: hypothetical protein HY318_10390 [Armatimonadetes bacterium]|nr:hypothetical protein [Armatimonadota bacterium]